MDKRSVYAVQTAKVLAILALTVALVNGITLNFSSRETCRDVQIQNARIFKSQQDQIDRITSGQYDEQYQRIYGANWREVKNSQLANLRDLRDRFAPHKCHLPIFNSFYHD